MGLVGAEPGAETARTSSQPSGLAAGPSPHAASCPAVLLHGAGVAGAAFFWTFEVLVFLVLLNFLLAIIVDAFSQVRAAGVLYEAAFQRAAHHHHISL